MRFAIAKNLDRLRRTIEGFSRPKFADTAISDTDLSHNDEDSVEHRAETQFALKELRNLVLETTSLEMTLRTDPADDGEIEPFSLASINSGSMETTDDLLDPTVGNHCREGSLPATLASLTGRSLGILVQQA